MCIGESSKGAVWFRVQREQAHTPAVLDCCKVTVALYFRGFWRMSDVMAAPCYAPEPSSCCVALVEEDATLAGITAPAVFGGNLSDTEDFEAGVADVTFDLTYKSFASNRIFVTLLLYTLFETKSMQRDMFTVRIGEMGGTRTLRVTNFDQREGELKWVLMRHGAAKQVYEVGMSGLCGQWGEGAHSAILFRSSGLGDYCACCHNYGS